MTRAATLPWRSLWPWMALAGLILIFALMLVFSRKAPLIASLDPPMAAPGQTVTVNGDYFGRTAREGSLSLAGEIPPPSLILSWTDQKIVFTVPEDASSGIVTVANSQGTSPGVLFTNTQSIPTVLQAGGPVGLPLVLSLVPASPVSGQVVTVAGRGLGSGSERSTLELTGGEGPVWVFGPGDSLAWDPSSLTFRWPAGLRGPTLLTVQTTRGRSPAFPVPASSPLVLTDPATLTLEIEARLNLPAGAAALLWFPFPQNGTGTTAEVLSADPPLGPGAAVRLDPGLPGERRAVLRLKLQTWARRSDGPPAGPAAVTEAPAADPRPGLWWKPAQAAVKALSTRWGLDVADPWTRLARLQAGLAASFKFTDGAVNHDGLSAPADRLLSQGLLDSAEAASLGAYLAQTLGLASRLVSGLWMGPDGQVVTRVWSEVFLPGSGWLPWDPASGPPGNLDNRHVLLENELKVAQRRLPRSQVLAVGRPGSPAAVSGEVSAAGPLPALTWKVTVLGK